MQLHGNTGKHMLHSYNIRKITEQKYTLERQIPENALSLKASLQMKSYNANVIV